ncbi:MAG TPA: type II toxin-antitoxin system HicB family antitoxin [Chthoniobacterales bacterium]
MKYLTKIYWSEESDAYMAEVPALPGCMSHGATYEEAARNIQEAMEAWTASAKKHGDPIPEPDLAAEEIAGILPILNVSKLARLAGMSKSTLASKMRRRTKFTDDEARRLLDALTTVHERRNQETHGNLKPAGRVAARAKIAKNKDRVAVSRVIPIATRGLGQSASKVPHQPESKALGNKQK